MSGTLDDTDITAYRDAIGAVMASRRGDEDAVQWLLTFQPSLKTRTSSAFIAMMCGLMKELERTGGDPDALLDRWAKNLSVYGTKK